MDKHPSPLHFCGRDFMLSRSELSEDLAEALEDCGRSGDASEAVAFVLAIYEVTGEIDDCRAMLAPYGAWDDAELSNHPKNLERLVWLAGCDLREQGEIYFSGY
ncbi:hypothetical protein [Rhizobium sp. RAF56]|uniref:hypothetical protein n=1 Tax=Rhizobium sp. RAF56 TaxID=3233062 RepID=UPI003F9E61F0